MTFQPGQSGNPKGTRKDKLFRDALLLELHRVQPDDRTALAHIARATVQKAMEGDIQAIKEVADRIDGKPAQEQEININETKTVLRAPSPESTTEAWMKRNTKSSGNPSLDRKLNS